MARERDIKGKIIEGNGVWQSRNVWWWWRRLEISKQKPTKCVCERNEASLKWPQKVASVRFASAPRRKPRRLPIACHTEMDAFCFVPLSSTRRGTLYARAKERQKRWWWWNSAATMEQQQQQAKEKNAKNLERPLLLFTVARFELIIVCTLRKSREHIEKMLLSSLRVHIYFFISLFRLPQYDKVSLPRTGY